MSTSVPQAAPSDASVRVSQAGHLEGQHFGTTDVLALFPTMSITVARPARPPVRTQST